MEAGQIYRDRITLQGQDELIIVFNVKAETFNQNKIKRQQKQNHLKHRKKHKLEKLYHICIPKGIQVFTFINLSNLYGNPW